MLDDDGTAQYAMALMQIDADRHQKGDDAPILCLSKVIHPVGGVKTTRLIFVTLHAKFLALKLLFKSATDGQTQKTLTQQK